MIDFFYFITALFVGGIITWYVSKKFYLRATEDLNEKASKLVKKIDFILKGMEEEGRIKWTKDEQGNVIGIFLQLSGSSHIKFNATGNLTKKTKEKNESNQIDQ